MVRAMSMVRYSEQKKRENALIEAEEKLRESEQRYREIFSTSRGRYGTTLEYADQTLRCLRENGIRDLALQRLLGHAP